METQRLILDSFKESDREDYYCNISHDRSVLETFICPYTETPEELDVRPYVTNKSLFAIRLKETGRLIGIVLSFHETDGCCEIGYAIGSRCWGRGYASEAVRCFLAYLFEERGFRRVYASFFTGNEASRRVMENCGLRFWRRSEKELTYLGVERDLIYYTIDREQEQNHVYEHRSQP